VQNVFAPISGLIACEIKKTETMSYKATARSIHGSLRHQVDVNGRHTIITDEPERFGGTDSAPSSGAHYK
jgi:hypothetical protein